MAGRHHGSQLRQHNEVAHAAQCGGYGSLVFVIRSERRDQDADFPYPFVAGTCGPVAQMVERLLGRQEVRGSIPLRSTA
jgi:hypothetical protein